MADIKERLAKLAQLVRHDDEARGTCEDAIKRIETLEGGDTAPTGSVYVAGTWTWASVPPPGPKTQVKWDSMDWDIVGDLHMFGNAMIHFYTDEHGDLQTRRIDPKLLKMNDDGSATLTISPESFI